MIISPNVLEGTIKIPSSKSEAHRAIMCASFAEGDSIISNVTMSEDIIATINCLRNLGAEIEVVDRGDIAEVKVGKYIYKKDYKAVLDANESGSTLRFIIPIAVSLYDKVKFTGKSRLVKRPLSVYFDIFKKNNIKYSHGENFLPLETEGKLDASEFEMSGDISSQFITGVMLAKGIAGDTAHIKIVSNLESKPYIDITQDVMNKFGVGTEYDEIENEYIIKNSGYKARNYKVMGDWSHAGFWLLMGTKSKVTIAGLDKNSKQGDKAIVEILKSMGANIYWDGDLLVSEKAQLHGKTIDVSQCPDLAPVIGAAMAVAKGDGQIIGGERLKIKESDRIKSVVDTICRLGGKAVATDDGMVIEGIRELSGGSVSCYNDHRIAMMVGALSTYCSDIISVDGHQCVAKSYPEFWNDFKKLGGRL